MRRQVMPKDRCDQIAWDLTTTPEYRSFIQFASRFFRVMNRPETSGHGKAAQFVPFRLNPVQVDFYRRMERARLEGRPGRFIVLKARRMGLSTLIQAYMLHQCLTNKGRRAFITAVDKITTDNIFRMIKSMWSYLPVNHEAGRRPKKGDPPRDPSAPVKLDLRPEIRRNNDYELWFAHPSDEKCGLNSRVDVAIASAVDSTRGFEVHMFHGCLAKGSPVVTPDGWHMPIEEFEVGDLVVTHTGEVAPISFVSRQRKDCLAMWLRGEDQPLVLTPEHKVWSRVGNPAGVMNEVRALRVGDEVGLPLGNGKYRWQRIDWFSAAGEQEVYDFEVDHPDHSYCTPYCAVSNSEVAFWGDPETFMLGLMQTLSDDPETLVVLESTANGAGGYFYNAFWDAWKSRDESGRPVDSDWEAVFYPWHAMPNYQRSLGGLTREELLSRFDDVMFGMVDEYSLSPEQAYWAYRTWKDKCNASWDQFRQEYPGKPEEAFAFSADRVFAEPDMLSMERFLESPKFVGDVVDASAGADDETFTNAGLMEPRLRPGGDGGPLWVWWYPSDDDADEEDERYIVSVDPSSGASSGDWTAMHVINARTRVQVAEYHAKLDPMNTAIKAVLLARYYNNALLIWEVNGVGHAVSLGIDQTDYWNLYQRDHVEGLTVTNGMLGWTTNTSTKPIMVGVGAHAVRQRLPIIRSRRLYEEMRKFMEVTERGRSARLIQGGDEVYKRVKVGAPRGEHDDLVMAWLLALVAAEQEVAESSEHAGGTLGPRGGGNRRWNQWSDDVALGDTVLGT